MPTPKRLCQSSISTTATAVYVGVSDGKTAINDLFFTNTTASQVTVSLFIGSAVDSHAVLHQVKVSANDYLHIGQMYQIINQGESVYALSSASGVNLTMSGTERI